MSQTEPNIPPQEDPTHDVPVYPEQDPPPGNESAIEVAWDRMPGVAHSETLSAAQGGAPGEGAEDDVDEDDLDPQAPHSPPDVKKSNVVFDENAVTG